MNKVEGVVNQIQSLPTLPQVVQKVITMVENPGVSSAELAKTISMDASMVSKILKVVNSAYYGLPRKISTLTQATVILGFNTIKNIVLTASVFTAFEGNGSNHRFSRKKFWEHSIGCAASCKVLSKRIRLGLPEEAFVAGLIHDIGKIVLDQFLHDHFEKILDVVDSHETTFLSAEQKVIGVDHTQIGEWLCDKWRFPQQVQESVKFHHSPLSAQDHKKMVAIVHLGNAISRLENMGYGGDNQPPEIISECWEVLNIPEEEMGDLIVEIKNEFEKSSVFLELLKG